MAAPLPVSPNWMSLTMAFSDKTVPQRVQTVWACSVISRTASSPHEVHSMLDSRRVYAQRRVCCREMAGRREEAVRQRFRDGRSSARQVAVCLWILSMLQPLASLRYAVRAAKSATNIERLMRKVRFRANTKTGALSESAFCPLWTSGLMQVLGERRRLLGRRRVLTPIRGEFTFRPRHITLGRSRSPGCDHNAESSGNATHSTCYTCYLL